MLLSCTGLVTAGNQKNVHVMAGGGAALPLNYLHETCNTGLVGYAAVGVRPAPVSSPEVEVGARLEFVHFPQKQDEAGDYSFFMAGLGLRLDSLVKNVHNIYLNGNAGLARTEYDDNGDTKDTENNPYISLALGIEFSKFAVEARGTNVFGTRVKNLNWLQLTVGFRL
jgi:hypothetical protein